MIAPTFKFKTLFFDQAKVIRAMDEATRRSLSRAGGYVRSVARNSMRPDTKAKTTATGRKRRRTYQPSPPGSPPKALKPGALMRALLFFGYDTDTESVVVGPQGFPRSDTPALHEFGGTRTVNRRGKAVVQNFPPRPFMHPALEQSIDDIPEPFRNSIKG